MTTTFQHRRLVTADQILDRHVGREVSIGNVTGVLIGANNMRGRVDLTLMVGKSRAEFMLTADAVVEIGRKL